MKEEYYKKAKKLFEEKHEKSVRPGIISIVALWLEENIDKRLVNHYVKNLRTYDLFRAVSYLLKIENIDDLHFCIDDSANCNVLNELCANLCLNKLPDFSAYLNKGFNCNQLCQIVMGLAEGFDISVYADKKFSWEQMKVLRLAFTRDIDPSVFAIEEIDSTKMNLILDLLERGLNIEEILDKLDVDFYTFCEVYNETISIEWK